MANALIGKLIPRQKKMSTSLGGLLIIVGETMFLFSLLNFLMITRLQYYSAGDSFIRKIFPVYSAFIMAMFIVAFIGMWLTYIYVFPSKQRFAQEQAIKDDRSPLYNKMNEMQNELAKMRGMMEKLSEQVEDIVKDK